VQKSAGKGALFSGISAINVLYYTDYKHFKKQHPK
jgi:hypothetical protein